MNILHQIRRRQLFAWVLLGLSAWAALPLRAQSTETPPTTAGSNTILISPDIPNSALVAPVGLQVQGSVFSRIQGDGGHALVFTDNVYVFRPLVDIMADQDDLSPLLGTEPVFELRAQRGVVFYEQEPIFQGSRQVEEIVRGVYLEGDVVFQAGPQEVTAEQMYYDPVNRKALVLDGQLKVSLPGDNLPLYLRALELRQQGEDRFAAEHVVLTNDEFATPATSLQARRGRIVQLPADEEQPERYYYVLNDVTANIGTTPVLWWPRLSGTTTKSETPLKAISLGYNNTYGMAIESKWDLARALSVDPLEGLDTTLRLDEFTHRGPATGVDADYIDSSQGRYFGNLRTYLVHDDGEDDLGKFASRDAVPLQRDWRGRARLQHRQYLPLDWQMTAEISYLSDRNFLESWEEREFNTDKGQETLLYFKQQRNNWAADFLTKWHLNNFDYTLTEMPSATFHLAGQDIFEVLTYHMDARLSRYREHAGERLVPGPNGLLQPSILPSSLDSEAYFYGMSRHELSLPLHAGGWHVAPTVIGTIVQNDNAEDQNFFQGAGGVRTSTQWWHVDNSAHSRMFDINRIRHIVVPEASYFVVDSDTTERVTRDVFNAGLRQRWQTKRGPEGDQHTVDFLRLGLGVTLVSDDQDRAVLPNRYFFSRPETQYGVTPFVNPDFSNLGLARREELDQTTTDFCTADWTWLVSENTALTGMFNYDIAGGNISQTETGIAVQRTPRTSYYFGQRYTHLADPFDNTDSHVLTASTSYRINRKYTVAVTHEYDIDRTDSALFQTVVIRKFNHWFGAFGVGYDATRDSLSFQLSIWPESFERVAIGSRRFSRITD